MQQTPPSISYIPGLDGLRGIACLAVFGVHFAQITDLQGSMGPFDWRRLLENGNTGVALFFVLSGFLLATPFWQAAASANGRTTAIGAYMARRLARILPAYYVCLTALILLNRHWADDNAALNLTLHFLLLFNFNNETFYSVNPPFWTLGIEFQFYLLLPMLFAVLGTAVRSIGIHVMALLAILSYVAHLSVMLLGGKLLPFNPNEHVTFTHSLLAHLPLFLLGVCGSWGYLRVTSRAHRAHSTLTYDSLFSASLLSVFVILSTSLDGMLQLPYGRYNLPYVPLLLFVMIVSAPLSRLAQWVLESFPLKGLGKISYGIYIYHLPIMHFTARMMNHYGLSPASWLLLFCSISLAVSVLTAMVSYRLVEQPFVKFFHGGRRFDPAARGRRL